MFPENNSFIIDFYGNKTYRIRCKCCAAEGGWGKTKNHAIKNWNMRVNNE